MKKINFSRQDNCKMRHKRITNKIKLIDNKVPRLIVTRSNSHISVQIFDDQKGVTLISSSSMQLKLLNGNIENAKLVGIDIAKKAVAMNITKISFDRGGNKYHGRVAALAQAARENGLSF